MHLAPLLSNLKAFHPFRGRNRHDIELAVLFALEFLTNLLVGDVDL